MGKLIRRGIDYTGSGSGSGNERELTQLEYNSLTYDEKHNGTTYYITDGSGDDPEGPKASGVIYTTPSGEETSVQDEITQLKNNLGMKAMGIIPAGETSIEFTDNSFTDVAIIEVYFWDKVMAPTAVTRENNTITIEISAQTSDTKVGVTAR